MEAPPDGSTVSLVAEEPKRDLMIDRLHSNGPCAKCGQKGCCYKDQCLVCRTPPDRRELVKHGVPRGSADALAIIMRKCNGDANFVLGKVHPRLMENIEIRDGRLRLKSRNYRWMRRCGWVSVAPKS